MVEKAQETDSVNLENKSVVTSPVTPPAPNQTNNNASRVHTRNEKRSGNTLYQEISFQVSCIFATLFCEPQKSPT